MAYLGWAWRKGFDGPRENPVAPSYWDQILGRMRSIPREADAERVITLHTRWLAVADKDKYSAVVLKMHYRDGYSFTDSEVLEALDRFSRA